MINSLQVNMINVKIRIIFFITGQKRKINKQKKKHGKIVKPSDNLKWLIYKIKRQNRIQYKIAITYM